LVRSPQNRDQQLLTLQKKEVGHDCFFPRRFHSPGLHHEDHRRGPGSGKGGSIVLGALITFGVFLQRLIKEGGRKELVHQFRRDLGMAILLGLEFLIASDIDELSRCFWRDQYGFWLHDKCRIIEADNSKFLLGF